MLLGLRVTYQLLSPLAVWCGQACVFYLHTIITTTRKTIYYVCVK